MMKLKRGQESITVVDGAFAGRQYIPGKAYSEVPPEEAWRFEEFGKFENKTGYKFDPKTSKKIKGELEPLPESLHLGSKA